MQPSVDKRALGLSNIAVLLTIMLKPLLTRGLFMLYFHRAVH